MLLRYCHFTFDIFIGINSWCIFVYSAKTPTKSINKYRNILFIELFFILFNWIIDFINQIVPNIILISMLIFKEIHSFVVCRIYKKWWESLSIKWQKFIFESIIPKHKKKNIQPSSFSFIDQPSCFHLYLLDLKYSLTLTSFEITITWTFLLS